MGRNAISALVLLGLIGVGGCGLLPGQGSSDYSRDHARTEQTVRRGTIENVREVSIEGTRSGVGAVAGGALGGVAGSTVGRGRGAVAGAVVGAVLGGVGGAVAEQGVTKQKGLELEIKLDSGKSIIVVQAPDQQFKVGDQVRIISGGGDTRVTR
jgi:outer membrane lipoprotein SlyB